jgi:hypothetical protein
MPAGVPARAGWLRRAALQPPGVSSLPRELPQQVARWRQVGWVAAGSQPSLGRALRVARLVTGERSTWGVRQAKAVAARLLPVALALVAR